MRSPTHWDGVACRDGDQLTRWLEDAVDEADDEAEAKTRVAVGVVRQADMPCPGQQHGALPETRGVQPPGVKPKTRSKELVLNLTDAEYATIKAYAEGDEMPPSTWARLKIMDALALLKAGE